MSLMSLWSRMSGIKLLAYGGYQFPIIDGQSLALGYNGTVEERKDLTYRCRAGIKQLLGLRRSDDAADIYLHGPGTMNYAAAHATAMVAAAPTANAPAVHTFALALDAWRRRQAATLYRMIIGFNGIAGQSILEFDRNAATGTLGTLIRDNHARWYSEGRSLASGQPLVYGFIQGEANVSMTPSAYRAAATIAFNDALGDIEAAFGTRPPLMLWQTGGYIDSTGQPYGSTLAQLDLVADFDAIFAGPLYPILTYDNQVHPDMASQIVHTEIAAYVFLRHEQGQNINLLPGAPVWSGNTVRIQFSTEGGKALAFDAADKYAAYGGLANHGVEATGAAITGVTLDGNAVVVACDGPMTQVQIAMQAQNMAGFVDGNGKNYPAHRCDIMEASPADSLMLPGTPLKRFIPSCRFTRP